MANHEWVKSTLGHGETMCKHCKITNREAAVLGKLNECDMAPQPVTLTPAGLVERLRDDTHMTQGDGLAATLDTAHQAADALTASQADLAQKERVIVGLNKQLTEQFDLSSKFAAENERLKAEWGTAREAAAFQEHNWQQERDLKLQMIDRAAELETLLDKAVEAMREASEDIDHWGGYAGEYLQDKHDLEGDLDRISKQIATIQEARHAGE